MLSSSGNISHDRLEIGQHAEKNEESYLRIISKSIEKFDCFCDKNGSFAQMNNELLWNTIAQLKYKGIKLRLITEITKENITYCKTMMRYFDVRHVDGVKGNFAISDHQDYLGNILSLDENPDKQLIHISNKAFVELQQYIFNTIWSKAIPAKEKIKEIELGLDKEFLKILRDPQIIKKTLLTLLGSATYEILFLFSTANSFHRAEREGVLEALKDAVKRGVNVRLMVPRDDEAIKEISEKKLKEKRKQIHIQYITKHMQNNIVTLIIDQEVSLSTEINDDKQNIFEQSIGPVTFSNVESTVSSWASIFESMWIQSELDKQNNIKQTYFKVFNGQGLRDETYERRWQDK